MQKNFLFRRTGVIVTLFALILGFACNISFASTPMQRELKVYVDDREVKFPDAKPYISEAGRTMVPIRAVAESFGAKVDWDAVLRKVTITYDDIEIEFLPDYVEDVMLVRSIEKNQRKPFN